MEDLAALKKIIKENSVVRKTDKTLYHTDQREFSKAPTEWELYYKAMLGQTKFLRDKSKARYLHVLYSLKLGNSYLSIENKCREKNEIDIRKLNELALEFGLEKILCL